MRSGWVETGHSGWKSCATKWRLLRGCPKLDMRNGQGASVASCMYRLLFPSTHKNLLDSLYESRKPGDNNIELNEVKKGQVWYKDGNTMDSNAECIAKSFSMKIDIFIIQ